MWCRQNHKVFGNSNQLVFLRHKHGRPQLLCHHLSLVGLHAPDLWQLDRLAAAEPVVEERILRQVVANREEEFLVGCRARHVERVGRPTLGGLLVITGLFDRHPSLVNEDLRDIRFTGQIHPQPLPFTALEPVPGTDAGGAVLVDHHLDQGSRHDRLHHLLGLELSCRNLEADRLNMETERDRSARRQQLQLPHVDELETFKLPIVGPLDLQRVVLSDHQLAGDVVVIEIECDRRLDLHLVAGRRLFILVVVALTTPVAGLQVPADNECHRAGQLLLHHDSPGHPAVFRLASDLLADRHRSRSTAGGGGGGDLGVLANRLGHSDPKRVGAGVLDGEDHLRIDLDQLLLCVGRGGNGGREPCGASPSGHRQGQQPGRVDRRVGGVLPGTGQPRAADFGSQLSAAVGLDPRELLLVGDHLKCVRGVDQDRPVLANDAEWLDHRQRNIDRFGLAIECLVGFDHEAQGTLTPLRQHDCQDPRCLVEAVLLVSGPGDPIEFETGRQLQLPLEDTSPLDGVLQLRHRSQLVVTKNQPGGVIDGDSGLHRFVGHPQVKPRTEVLVGPSGGTPYRLEDLVGLDPHQSPWGGDIQCQIGSVRQDDLATLADRVKRMDTVDRHARIVDRRFLDPRGVDARDGEDLAHRRSGTLGVHLEHKLALHGTDELDGDHLTLLLVDRHPLADLGLGRGDIQDPVAQGDGDSQLGQFATQHLVVQKHVGVYQAITDRDMLVVRDTGQQVHVRLLTDTGVPQGRDLGGGAQASPNPCPPLVRFDRQRHQARRQVDGLLGPRNRQLERGHSHRRTVEIKGVSVG